VIRTLVAMLLLSSPLAAGELRSAEAEALALPEAQEAARFADHLAAQGDHYRAIGEYKRALFLAPTAPEAARWELGIGESLRQGEQHEQAARQFDQVAETRREVRGEALLGAARSYFAANQLEAAASRAKAAAEAFEPPAKVREARFTEGWALLRAGRDAEAKAAFEAAKGPGVVGEGAARVVEVLPQLETLPARNPVLAGVLGLVPGLGHLYIGEPATAVSALVWNGVFAWAIYETVQQRQWPLVTVLAMFQTMWYGGSIVGAISGAQRYNRDARLNAMDDIAGLASPRLVDEFGALRR
jgi:hypothetical protein